MNAFDELLAWASEVGGGSWQQWRASCAHLRLEPTAAARSVSDLGHVEFDWGADRFGCAPPAAVLIPRSSGSVIVTGARPVGLYERLAALCEEGEFDLYFHSALSQSGGPATWLIEADLGDVAMFCRSVGLEFEVDAGRRIAGKVPAAALSSAAESEPPDPRYPQQWFDPVQRAWRSTCARPDGSGLWWVEEIRRKTAYVRHAGQWYRVPVREYGPYLAYPDTCFLRYHLDQMELAVHAMAPLPPLLARAATLQSGRLPLARNGSRIYVNIDLDLAELIASRLSAVLEVSPTRGQPKSGSRTFGGRVPGHRR